MKRVQWYGSSGSGVRSWALYGITKVHLVADDAYVTLCGRRVPRASKLITPDDPDKGNDCKRCVAMSS